MENATENKHTPHCLILPFPIAGHINPMIQFSKRLSHNGITITLAATKYLSKTMQEFSGPISIETISDGFDEGGMDFINGIDAYVDRFRHVGSGSLSELLEKLRNSGRSVDCVIYDAFIPWALVVAKKFGVLGAAFFTQSCAVNIVYYSVWKKQLKVPVLDEEVLLPGLPRMEASDLPSFVRDKERRVGALELVVNQFEDIEEADFVFVNSVHELEEEATNWLTRFLPQVKTIGPTIPSMYDKRLLEDKHYGLSIFKTVDTCMQWLEKHATRSVIYVSFGSMAKLEGGQMNELALSLKMTNKPFIWVVRSSEESKLPKNFAQETSEKGLIVSWCPQLEVLAHDAVGCFVTHCGWNSTLEALSLGVPVVAMPWWSDQSTNTKFVMDVWKMGIRARADDKNIVRCTEIVRCMKHVMEEGEGEEKINNARKWKEITRKAVDEGGSSDRNILEFVTTILATSHAS